MESEIWDQQAFMARILNNEKIAERLISLLKSETPKTIANLEKAIEEGKTEEAGKIAHTLKGSASNLGGLELATLANKIEVAGRELDMDEVKILWPEVKPKFDRLIDCIDQR